jgi:hypothetical protein
MRRIQSLLTITLALFATNVNAQLSDNIQISGYFQAMPVWINADLPEPFPDDSFWEYRLQNRLNIRWDITSDWTFNWQMRTRFFAGDLVSDIPFYSDFIDVDDGLVNLSWLIAERDSWFLHYIPDRLNLEWDNSDWSVRIGRQRINWGINMITNPNDLFNIYSFYEFDYPERPGADAVRIQHFTGPFSRWDLAISPAREARQTVGALMYGFNRRGYDIQVLGGYFHNRLAAGGGWAGSIEQTGFKGELMLFTDLEESGGSRQTNVVVALSADHMFDNSLFLVVEGLYNQAGGVDQFILTGETLSADNPSFSRFQLTGHATYPFTPIFQGSLAAIIYPDESAVFLNPSITWSLLQDLDLNLFTQLFIGSDDSVFANAGNVVGASLMWNF